jgi:hypothetical protein
MESIYRKTIKNRCVNQITFLFKRACLSVSVVSDSRSDRHTAGRKWGAKPKWRLISFLNGEIKRVIVVVDWIPFTVGLWLQLKAIHCGAIVIPLIRASLAYWRQCKHR